MSADPFEEWRRHLTEGEVAQRKLETVCEIMKVICEEMDCDNRPVEDADYCEAQKCPIWRLRSALEGKEAAEG